MTRSQTPRAVRTRALLCAALVLAASLSAPTALSAVTDPEPVVLEPPAPTGPHPTGRTTLHLVDPDRGHPWVPAAEDRDVVVDVWYPARGGGEPAPYVPASFAETMKLDFEQYGIPRDAVDAAGARTASRLDAEAVDAHLPVLLFSPGMGMSRHQYTALGEDLASRGFVVAAMDHPYEALVVELPDGRLLRTALPTNDTGNRRLAGGVRLADARFVLDRLEGFAAGEDAADDSGHPLPRGLADALDMERVGMFGHSLGGVTTAETMLVDDRVDAGVNMDGSLAYHVGDEEWSDATLAGASRPFALMGAGASGDEGLPHHSDHSPDWRLFVEASSAPVLEVYMPDGEHMASTDLQWIAPQLEEAFSPSSAAWRNAVRGGLGTVDPEDSVAAQRAHLAAFFDHHLRGGASPLPDPAPAVTEVTEH
ncbi:alpha/beta hydrolase family protein [Nocardiopsis changdeensis]|uniref:alpha/beta hydrolase family protein n=1 Tax=Nocardiopsis changdeensis TaxID=2831969 RepID=UPI003F45933A